MPDEKPMDRRRFFRRGLAELLKPITSAISPLEKAARKIGDLEPPPSRYPLNVSLRPPGALKEAQFKQTCSRCGECVRACPVHCIKIDSSGIKGEGAPYIEVDFAACVVCDGLHCMDVCPTGALVPTGINDIDMGTAVWQQETCLLSSGQQCRVCVDECPLGEMAITIKNNQIEVKPLGCIGCGTCQHFCPTNPKSIIVIPKAAKER